MADAFSQGWFLKNSKEIVQILRYAARALELAGDVVGGNWGKGFQTPCPSSQQY